MDISTNGSNSGVYLFDLDWNLGFGKRVGEKNKWKLQKKTRNISDSNNSLGGFVETRVFVV